MFGPSGENILRQQFGDRTAPRHELKWPVEAVAQLAVRRQAEAVVHGGDDIGRRNGIQAGKGADAVAGAMHSPFADAAAGEEQAVTEIPVIAAAGALELGR